MLSSVSRIASLFYGEVSMSIYKSYSNVNISEGKVVGQFELQKILILILGIG
jgi:hypothetical protein